MNCIKIILEVDGRLINMLSLIHSTHALGIIYTLGYYYNYVDLPIYCKKSLLFDK